MTVDCRSFDYPWRSANSRVTTELHSDSESEQINTLTRTNVSRRIPGSNTQVMDTVVITFGKESNMQKLSSNLTTNVYRVSLCTYFRKLTCF